MVFVCYRLEILVKWEVSFELSIDWVSLSGFMLTVNFIERSPILLTFFKLIILVWKISRTQMVNRFTFLILLCYQWHLLINAWCVIRLFWIEFIIQKINSAHWRKILRIIRCNVCIFIWNWDHRLLSQRLYGLKLLRLLKQR